MIVDLLALPKEELLRDQQNARQSGPETMAGLYNRVHGVLGTRI